MEKYFALANSFISSLLEIFVLLSFIFMFCSICLKHDMHVSFDMFEVHLYYNNASQYRSANLDISLIWINV